MQATCALLNVVFLGFFFLRDGLPTLPTRNLNATSSGKTIQCAGAKPSTKSSPKTRCFTNPEGESIAAATRSTALRSDSGLCTLTFAISKLANPKKWETAHVFDEQKFDAVRSQQSPGTGFIVTRDEPVCINPEKTGVGDAQGSSLHYLSGNSPGIQREAS